jgi:hypothetical protein
MQSAASCLGSPSNLSLYSSQPHRRALPAGPEPPTSLTLLLAYRSHLLTSAFIAASVEVKAASRRMKLLS